MTPQDVRNARMALGWSVETFADELGVSPRTIRRWEIDRGQNETLTPPPGAVDDINRLLERCRS